MTPDEYREHYQKEPPNAHINAALAAQPIEQFPTAEELKAVMEQRDKAERELVEANSRNSTLIAALAAQEMVVNTEIATPRVDAALDSAGTSSSKRFCAIINLSRQLERELEEANKEINERTEAMGGSITLVARLRAENGRLREALKGIDDALNECLMVPANVLPAWNKATEALKEDAPNNYPCKECGALGMRGWEVGQEAISQRSQPV